MSRDVWLHKWLRFTDSGVKVALHLTKFFNRIKMKNIAEYLKKKVKQDYIRKDAQRRILITEITRRLNIERDRDNEEKITRYMWTNQVSRAKAIATLSKIKDPKEKTYSPFTERGIFFKVQHLDTQDLSDFFDTCNAREKDGKSFAKCFFGNLKL